MRRTSWLTAFIFFLLTSSSILAQTTSGQIALVLTRGQGSPVAGVQVRFLSEANAELGRCTTDDAGACTVELPSAPADASGFIRGTLVIEGHGDRPLIWPGGLLELPQSLETLEPPVDVYATLGPQPETLLLDLSAPELAATATAFAEGALPTLTPEPTVSTITPQPTATLLPTALAAPTATMVAALAQEPPAAQSTSDSAPSADGALPGRDIRFWLAALLVGMLLVISLLYATYRTHQGAGR